VRHNRVPNWREVHKAQEQIGFWLSNHNYWQTLPFGLFKTVMKVLLWESGVHEDELDAAVMRSLIEQDSLPGTLDD
tara:strand:+ start:82 stop:309 length:228 start_codon:yes stop_codon:yes gene_type:complete